MIGEAGTTEVRLDAQEAAPREDDATRRESGSFLSTHLLRELISTDARSEAAGEPLAERAAALLAVILAGLELDEGAIVQSDPSAAAGVCLASRGIPDHARELLEGRLPHLEELGGSLLQRALSERRVLLLDRSTRDPLMPALRDGNPDVEYAAVVPLADQGIAVGVLLLAARGRRLSPSFLRSLAVAFRLLGLLLAPGRGRLPAPPRLDEATPGQGDGERLLFEIEELTARLGEARTAARQMEERASAADAALRAEIESSRARTAELEARLAGASPARDRELELESVCAEQARTIEQHEHRVAELEGELATLMERVALHPGDERRIATNGATSWDEDTLGDNAAFGDGEAASTATIELPVGDEEQLGEIAAAAAAALEEDAGRDGRDEPLDGSDTQPIEVEPAAADQAEDAPASVLVDPAGEAVVDPPTQTILHIDARPGARSRARDAAETAGASYWDGTGEVPGAGGVVVLANLLDDALAQLVAADVGLWSALRWIVYGAAGDSGMGFDLGPCALIHRPIDPRRTLEQLHATAGRKVNGIMIVTAQLREVAPLRQALQEVDAGGSVACDMRQALDLLEIIRRPDAIFIDLALPKGQAFALAAQLRRQRETADLPILLLLPSSLQPGRLAAEAEKAQLLGPFGDEDVHRLVCTALAGRH